VVAVAERDQLVQLVPKILTSRKSTLNEVASAVEEAKAMRDELLLQARQTQERLQSISVDSALAKEEKVMQSSAAQIGLAAQSAGDGMRRATAALQMATQSRERAESDYQRIQEAMRARLAALRAQEETLMACNTEHAGLEAEVKGLIESTANQVEQFRAARNSVSKFTKQLNRISGADAVQADVAAPSGQSTAITPVGGQEDRDAAATAASAAFGLFGSILKAGAQGLRDSADAAKKRQKPE